MAPCLQLGVLGPIPVGGDQFLEPPAGVLAGLAKCKRSLGSFGWHIMTKRFAPGQAVSRNFFFTLLGQINMSNVKIF